jgi:starch phosphorylase
VARVINGDPDVAGRLKVVFVPNYGATLAEKIMPAADLSEQISTAGMEASGTGNMKLALNGALTIGTLDGANIEMREHVGAENLIIFGLTAEQVAERQRAGFTGAMAVDGIPGKDVDSGSQGSPRLAAVLESLQDGTFSPDDPGRFSPIVESLLAHDRFMVASDFEAYWHAQRAVDALWRSPRDWWRMSILNTARMSWFSSDRAIREYAREIWHVPVGL